MEVSVKSVVMIAVSLLVIAIVLPLGIGYIGMAGQYNVSWSGVWNETATTLADVLDPSVITILTVLIPILAVIGIAIGFLSMRD